MMLKFVFFFFFKPQLGEVDVGVEEDSIHQRKVSAIGGLRCKYSKNG